MYDEDSRSDEITVIIKFDDMDDAKKNVRCVKEGREPNFITNEISFVPNPLFVFL